MSREQFDNTFSLFQLSEITHSHQSTSQVKNFLELLVAQETEILKIFYTIDLLPLKKFAIKNLPPYQ